MLLLATYYPSRTPELARAGLSAHTLCLLTELFLDTWFTVPADAELHHTLRGTKPGDPFGDIVFNFLMGRIAFF